MKKSHISVLLDQVVSHLNIVDGGKYLDCTFGAGGYSCAFLEAANCEVLAIDRDSSVIQYAEPLLSSFGDRFRIQFGSFEQLEDLVQFSPHQKFDGIAFDLGVSSMQIDTAMRGFSFLRDGPLDMRMDQTQVLDAQHIVNSYSEELLSELIREYGGERKSRAISKAIVEQRQIAMIDSTIHLVQIVKKAVGRYDDSINPATRTFQALRIAVNNELEQLQKGLQAATRLLKEGGKLAVVTFHSGEAEIVKNFFSSISLKSSKKNKYQNFSKVQQDKKSAEFQLITRKALSPSDAEIALNPRSRSAQLRVLKRIAL